MLVGGRASDCFSQSRRQHRLIKREVGHQPFQPAGGFFSLPQAAEFAHAEGRGRRLPGVEGGVTPPQLPTEIADQGPTLGLPDRRDNLLFRKS
jgi:hypothetical protein